MARSRAASAAANSSPPTASARSSPSGTSRSWSPASTAGRSGDPNLHEPRLERELGVQRVRRQPPASDGDRHPGRPIPALALVPEVQAARRPLQARRSFDSNKCARLQPDTRAVALRRRLRAGPHRRLPVHALGARGQAARGRRTSCASRRRARRRRCGTSRSAAAAARRARWTRRSTDSRSAMSRRASATTVARQEQEDCDEPVRALQRGASNVWFGSHRSVISIPPWSESAFQLLDKHWDILRALSGQRARGRDRSDRTSRAGTPFTTDDLVEAVAERKRSAGGEAGPDVRGGVPP